MKRRSSGLNCLIGVDKPVGCTSHDVVARLRRLLGESRIGHAGTLDPLASGAMVVGVGGATRLMQFATSQIKSYRARIAFGRATETDDAEGATVREAPVPDLVGDRAWADEQMSVLRGMTEQVPPNYSAVHVDGARAYERARSGKPVGLDARPIEVVEATLVGLGQTDGEPWWDVDLVVSKGTYVRSLARDLGEALGSAAYVAGLRRLTSGSVDVEECLPPESFGQGWDGTTGMLDPVEVIGVHAIELDEDGLEAVRNGKRLSANRVEARDSIGIDEGERVALVYDSKLYALATKSGPALQPAPVFVDGIDGVGRR